MANPMVNTWFGNDRGTTTRSREIANPELQAFEIAFHFWKVADSNSARANSGISLVPSFSLSHPTLEIFFWVGRWSAGNVGQLHPKAG